MPGGSFDNLPIPTPDILRPPQETARGTAAFLVNKMVELVDCV